MVKQRGAVRLKRLVKTASHQPAYRNPEDFSFQHVNREIAAATRGEIRRKLEQDPACVRAWILLGNLYHATGEIEAARIAYERALQIDYFSLIARVELVSALGKMRRFDEAEAVLNESIRLHPYHVPFHFQMGLVRSAQGRREQGRALVLKALNMDPDYRPAREFLQKMHEAERAGATGNRKGER